MTHFLSATDLTREQALHIFRIAAALKQRWKAGDRATPLGGRTLALIFEKPSLRTRVTFEVGIVQLGGRAVYLAGSEVGMGTRESVPDVARNLSRWVDGIAARVYAHATVETLARHASVPVINGLSDFEHPCQALADYFTLWERGIDVGAMRLGWIGDGNNVCHSLMLLGALLGAEVVVACPPGYEPDPGVQARARSLGGRLTVTADAREGKRAQDALIQSLMKLGAHGQMGGIRQQIAQLEGLRDAPNLGAKLIGLGKGFLGDITGDLLGAGRPRQIEIINRRIAELRGQLGAAGEDFGAPGRAVRAGADQSVAAARLRRDMSGLVGGSRATDTALAEALRAQTLALNPETRAIARTTAARERLAAEIEVSITALSGARQLGEEAALRRRMIGAPALAITEALAVRDAIQRGVPPAAAQDAARQSRAAAASMQTTELLRTMGPQIAMQSLLAAQQGGGAGFAGAFFPGAAGLAAALPGVGPFAGAGIQLVGGLLGNLFSGIETSAERRHREHMEKLEKLAQEVGLERVTVVFTGPDGHQVRKTLAELESSDAVERVPVAVGASG